MPEDVTQELPAEFNDILAQSSLSEEDKKFWTKALKNAAPEVVFSILSYFQEFPDKIGWATDMLKRKVDAMKSKNQEAWNKILSEEEQELANIVNSQMTQ